MELVTLTRANGTARLRFARKDKRVNVLDEPCMTQLEAHLEALERDPPKRLVLESGMPGCFIAGADVDVIAAVRDADEAARLAERGQALFRRIETLPCPSVAVVRGAAMGGGLELALACDWLAAVEDEKTRLALPEIRLGIHPGFGGCVRLPRRVGWLAAVDMILSGRAVDARKARRMKLADIACKPGQEEAAIDYLARRGKARRGARPWWMRLPPARWLFFRQVEKKALARFRHLDVDEAYPAVPATIALLEAIAGLPEGQAYAREAESLGRLAVTPTCKNLIHVFRLGEGLKHQEAARKGSKDAEAIGRAAVFGAGVMGGGIAWVAAKTCEVNLYDVSVEALGRAMRKLAGLARRDEKRLARIRPAADRSGLEAADVVIEAVLEELEVKNELWREVEARVDRHALLLTNTSSLRVAAMQQAVKHPGRMAGMHFFNPAPKMPLVEVVAGPRTTKKTLAAVAALAVRWGKHPVIVRDAPGFLVNRCLMPYMTAAIGLVESGQRPEHVDGALKHFGMPMGALELADKVGLDICRHVGEHLSAELAGHRPLPAWLARMVDDGLLGEKSGTGFYVWEKGRRGEVNPGLGEYVRLPEDRNREEGVDAAIADAPPALADAAIVDACLLPMLAEALTCLREKVVDDAEHLDAAMIFGIGFPPFRGGLLHHFAAQDADDLAGRMKARGLDAGLLSLLPGREGPKGEGPGRDASSPGDGDA